MKYIFVNYSYYFMLFLCLLYICNCIIIFLQNYIAFVQEFGDLSLRSSPPGWVFTGVPEELYYPH